MPRVERPVTASVIFEAVDMIDGGYKDLLMEYQEIIWVSYKTDEMSP